MQLSDIYRVKMDDRAVAKEIIWTLIRKALLLLEMSEKPVIALEQSCHSKSHMPCQ